jgi:ribosomal protein S17E
MNNLERKGYGRNKNKLKWSDEKKAKFIKKYHETKEKKNKEHEQHLGKLIYFKKKYHTFDEFFAYAQTVKLRNKNVFNLNWKSDKIIKRFKDYFNENCITSQHKIENLCRFSSGSNLTLQYWIDRGWEQDFALKQISIAQQEHSFQSVKKMTNDRIPSQINYWIKKGFTKEEALIKRSEFQNRGSYVSKSSLNLFWPFYQQYKDLYTCYIHQKADPNSHEFGLWDKQNHKLYCYDFTIKELHLIFEYNGLHVHPNKEKLKEKWDEWRHYYTKETADEIQEKYDRKLQIAYNNNFKVIQLWESDRNNALKIKDGIQKAIHS